MIYLLDMFGVAVFAISGALTAGRKGMDLFGIVVVAIVTAVGGGTLRDVLLDRQAFWISDPTYLLAILTGTAAILVYARFFRPPEGSLLVADAFGLSLFTIIGAQTAELSGVPAPIVVVMGVMTGIVGGAMRDVLCAEVPLVLRKEIYATASIAGAVLFVVLTGFEVPGTFAVPASMALIFVLRVAAIRYDLNAPSVTFGDRPTPRGKLKRGA
jgi:uncharacterized membrane protein YeiH